MLKSILNREINRIAYQITSKYYSYLGSTAVKNASGDVMKILDQHANDKLFNVFYSLNKDFPLVVISEETGVSFLSKQPKYFIFVDPIDGSNNIRSDYTPSPNLCLSLGFGLFTDLLRFKDSRSFRSTITRDIFKGHFYTSDYNGHSKFMYMDQELEINVSKTNSSPPIIGVDLDNRCELDLQLIKIINSEIIQRRLGSSILDLCQVACGQYDGYVSNQARLKITDIAQSQHLIERSGGIFKSKCYLDNKLDERLNSSFMYDVLTDSSLLSRCKFTVVTANTMELYLKLDQCI